MRYAIDAAASELSLWTYKEGLLSRVAHDLCFRATDWEGSVEREGEAVSVELSLAVAGLKVQGQVRRGTVTPLADKDQREIEDTLRGEAVLDAARWPRIAFQGAGTQRDRAVQVQGQLTLRDRARPLSLGARLREEGEVLVCEGEVDLRQSEFGIKPYSALLGALKVQDGVRVSWSLRCRAL